MPNDTTKIGRRTVAARDDGGSGAQMLDRAVHILHLLGDSGSRGLRLTDVERKSGLTRPTAHRILKALEHHGFVAQRLDTRRYGLGLELAVLGATVSTLPTDLRQLCEQDVTYLAELTGNTAYLTIRSGYDTICLDRRLGSFPVQAVSVDTGMRRPLGTGASGIVLLASLSDDHLEDAIAAAARRLPDRPNVTERSIRASVYSARQKGYSYSDETITDGVRGIGVPIRDGQGATIAALSMSAIRTRVPASAVPALVQILRSVSSRIEKRLAPETTKIRGAVKPFERLATGRSRTDLSKNAHARPALGNEKLDEG
jgi:DNA-binding IclR family transcriptional regulator